MKSIIVLTAIVLSVSPTAYGQESGARQAHLSHLQEQAVRGGAFLSGKASEADEIKQKLSTLPSASTLPADIRETVTTLRSQWLVASGFTPTVFKALKDKGHDVEGALQRDIGGSISDYALVSEVVVVGMLESVVNEDLGDGFLSTARFSITDRIKGVVPGATINIRQRSGRDAAGNDVFYDTDFPKSGGSRYLLFVSAGLYGIGTTQKTGRQPARPGAYYLPQRSAFKISPDGSLVSLSEGIPVPTDRLDVIVGRIRSLGL